MTASDWRKDPRLPELKAELARLERQAVMRGNVDGSDSVEVIERLSQIDMAEALRQFRAGNPLI